MNRRTLIKAGLTAPMISPMAAFAKPAEKVMTSKNVIFICLDFGFLRQDLFYGENGDCKSPYFDRLDELKGKYTFFKGTHQPNLLNSSHKAHPAALTCVKHSQRAIYSMESIDQYIGRQSIRENRHRSVIFATSKTGRVNWNSSGQKVPGVSTVTAFHEKLFGDVDTSAELAAAQEQLKILSRAHQDIVKKASSSADEMLAASLKTKVNDLREDISWIRKGQPDFEVKIDKELGKGDQHVRMGDALNLCVEAFKHQLTKVATVYFDGSGSIDLKGIRSGYHGLSHKPRNPESLDQKEIVDKFVITSIVDHVKSLEERKMLDDTIVVVSGAMGNSASHSNENLPVFLMGGGLNHQGIVDCLEGDRKVSITLADVYQTVVAELGLPSMDLPYCKGPIKELLS